MWDDKVYRVVCDCGAQLYRQEIFDDESYDRTYTRQVFMLTPEGDEISACPGCHNSLSESITTDVPEIEPYQQLIRDVLKLLDNNPLGTVHAINVRVEESQWRERAEKLLAKQGA